MRVYACVCVCVRIHMLVAGGCECMRVSVCVNVFIG